MHFFFLACVLAHAVTVAATSNRTEPIMGAAEMYITEVLTAHTTVCPSATELTYNGATYTVTESTNLVITNCPCTVVKPIYTTSVVYCNTCTPTNTANPPVFGNNTNAAPIKPTVGSASGQVSPTTAATPSPIPASNGNKAIVFSGASLAGLLGLAVYIL